MSATLTRQSVASKIPAKRRGTSIRPTVDRFASLAYEEGILPDPLADLIDLVTKTSLLDQASLNSIIRALYPTTRLSGDAVLRVVGCLGHGELKPSLAIQASLLRWLVMVHHIIDSPNVLSQAYAVLFNLLDTAAIRYARLQEHRDTGLTQLWPCHLDHNYVIF
jgi:centromere protein I